MKKILSLLLTLCLLFSILPAQALAAVGDIRPAENNAVKQTTLSSGSLALQNDYIRVIARKDGTLSTAPATESADPTDRQTPYCYFVTYGSRHITHPASLRLKSRLGACIASRRALLSLRQMQTPCWLRSRRKASTPIW